MTRLTAEMALAGLVGLPLAWMNRVLGTQIFSFGEGQKGRNMKGQRVKRFAWKLAVSTEWRLEGPDGFELSSDHFGEPRTDGHALPFYRSLGAEGPVVEGVSIGSRGGLRLDLSKGYRLYVLVDEGPLQEDWNPHSVRWWRFYTPQGPEGGIVLDGEGFAEWS